MFLLQDIKVTRDSVNGHAAFDKATHSTTDSHSGRDVLLGPQGKDEAEILYKNSRLVRAITSSLVPPIVMAIICVATLGADIMITVDLPFTRLAEWVNTDETRGVTHQSFIRGGFVPWYSPLPLYTFYFYLFTLILLATQS